MMPRQADPAGLGTLEGAAESQFSLSSGPSPRQPPSTSISIPSGPVENTEARQPGLKCAAAGHHISAKIRQYRQTIELTSKNNREGSKNG